MNGISVIICCYNSENRIVTTLSHLVNQQVPEGLQWEILLVDNGCTDRTVPLSTAFLQPFAQNIPFRVVLQPIPGLSAARDMGIAQASYDILLFCDDDNLLAPDYLKRVQMHFTSEKDLAVLGGRAEPRPERQPPDWWFTFTNWYATGPQAPQSGWLTETRACVYGAGSVYRKDALTRLKTLGFTSRLSDRKGASLSSGGDIELGNALVLAGYHIYYDSQLRLGHWIPASRMTRSYLMRMSRQGSAMHPVLYAYQLHLRGIQRKPVQLTWWYTSLVKLPQLAMPAIKTWFMPGTLFFKWMVTLDAFWTFWAFLTAGNQIQTVWNSITNWKPHAKA